MRRLVWVLVGVVVTAAAVVGYGALQSESPHDRDLRDCVDRYGVSRYAEPDVRAYQDGVVAACMRGRGY